MQSQGLSPAATDLLGTAGQALAQQASSETEELRKKRMQQQQQNGMMGGSLAVTSLFGTGVGAGY